MSQNTANSPTNQITSNGSNAPVTLQSARNEPVYSPQQIDGALRPQLIRIDSRSTLNPRPAFLNPIRPGQPRPPANALPFLQRPPPPRVASPIPNTFQQNQMNPSRFPFQRPPNLGERPPQILQHRPDTPPRLPFSGNLPYRSITPESVETNFNLTSAPVQRVQNISLTEKPENNKSGIETPILVKKNGNPIINSTIGDTGQIPFNVRPRFPNSVGSMEDNAIPINVKSKINDIQPNVPPEKISEPKLPTNNNNARFVTPNTDKSAIKITDSKITSPSKIEVNEAKIEKKIRPDSRTNVFSKEGDNDSGVDEVTEGHVKNDNVSSNRSTRSSALPSAINKNRSFSRGDKSPSLKSPGFSTSDSTSAEKKKLPMNKIQVGSAASPNLKVVKSKIGSLQNATYKPGGGNIKIENRKIDFSTTSSRITAKNENYTPRGGDKKIQQQKLTWNATSKIGSLENASHKPKGGDKKIENLKLDFKDKAKSKVGSKDNIKYSPGGGDIKIENKKLEIKGQSKIGSLDNIKHKPGGGDKKIYEDKDYIRQMSAHSNVSLNDSHNSSQMDVREPASDENLNQHR